MARAGDALTPRRLRHLPGVAAILIAYVPLLLDRGSPWRVNVLLDPGLLEAIDREASRRRMTRSAVLSSAARAELRGEHGA